MASVDGYYYVTVYGYCYWRTGSSVDGYYTTSVDGYYTTSVYGIERVWDL